MKNASSYFKLYLDNCMYADVRICDNNRMRNDARSIYGFLSRVNRGLSFVGYRLLL